MSTCNCHGGPTCCKVIAAMPPCYCLMCSCYYTVPGTCNCYATRFTYQPVPRYTPYEYPYTTAPQPYYLPLWTNY